MGKPGVMFYFDIRPCLKRLSTEEKGLLFEASGLGNVRLLSKFALAQIVVAHSGSHFPPKILGGIVFCVLSNP